MQIPNIRHMRRRALSRTRHSNILLEFVSASAARTSETEQQIFESMYVPGSSSKVANLPDSNIET